MPTDPCDYCECVIGHGCGYPGWLCCEQCSHYAAAVQAPLRAEVLQLRAQRAADLVDLRAAAQDLHDLGNTHLVMRPHYELAAARVERVIARIHHRAGETPDE